MNDMDEVGVACIESKKTILFFDYSQRQNRALNVETDFNLVKLRKYFSDGQEKCIMFAASLKSIPLSYREVLTENSFLVKEVRFSERSLLKLLDSLPHVESLVLCSALDNHSFIYLSEIIRKQIRKISINNLLYEHREYDESILKSFFDSMVNVESLAFGKKYSSYIPAKICADMLSLNQNLKKLTLGSMSFFKLDFNFREKTSDVFKFCSALSKTKIEELSILYSCREDSKVFAIDQLVSSMIHNMNLKVLILSKEIGIDLNYQILQALKQIVPRLVEFEIGVKIGRIFSLAERSPFDVLCETLQKSLMLRCFRMTIEFYGKQHEKWVVETSLLKVFHNTSIENGCIDFKYGESSTGIAFREMTERNQYCRSLAQRASEILFLIRKFRHFNSLLNFIGRDVTEMLVKELYVTRSDQNAWLNREIQHVAEKKQKMY